MKSAQGLHVAIIMDGNGRWATRRGWPRLAGHRAGADSVRRVIEAAPSLGVTQLTLYAFSSDNWKRPTGEVSGLFRLLKKYLAEETARCAGKGVRIEFIGRRDRLSPALVEAMEESEQTTRKCRRLHLRIALDYSSREAIERREFTPDVDLLIRTSGEQRLSDFLLWECAYAELWFTPVLWPDFGASDLEQALHNFRGRQRRYGGLIQLQAG
ncbi:MAG: di-trans,poly-cis-decaprenylcistransferase [Bryobacterales bacterium]|nr:di-trans,poly-cis-decaprenylcistransferase [Bryobacterales bacterium]